MGPNLVWPQRTYGHGGRTGISASYCSVRASPRVLTSKIRERPQSNTLDEQLGGRKRGPGRVMGLGWGFMGSTHHTGPPIHNHIMIMMGLCSRPEEDLNAWKQFGPETTWVGRLGGDGFWMRD